ncbi:hypothetical protein ACFPEU_03425 [Streptomyces mangrovi]|uniref:Transposase n=1 Tax=Streptomyces mangrovi TaxID=1206892 RepID=A0ABV9IHM8_9ACTN
MTAFGMAGGMPQLRWLTTRITARFDRPFGFLGLHRHSRLVLAAGWVAQPARQRTERCAYEEDDEPPVVTD